MQSGCSNCTCFVVHIPQMLYPYSMNMKMCICMKTMLLCSIVLFPFLTAKSAFHHANVKIPDGVYLTLKETTLEKLQFHACGVNAIPIQKTASGNASVNSLVFSTCHFDFARENGRIALRTAPAVVHRSLSSVNVASYTARLSPCLVRSVYRYASVSSDVAFVQAMEMGTSVPNNSGTVLKANFLDSDEDDDWGSGTGGFPNPGEPGDQMPLQDATLGCCIMALLYALRIYVTLKNNF